MGNVRKLNEISKTQTNLIPHFWYVKLGVFLPREGEEGSFANPREGGGGDEYMDKFIYLFSHGKIIRIKIKS